MEPERDMEKIEQNLPLPGYGKIYNLGHKYLADLLNGEITVEEKVDGSQFSFGIKEGTLYFRSHGASVYPEIAPKLFKAAVDYIVSIKAQLEEGWTYRGEVLHKPRHNTLTYGRVPKHNVVLFDIEVDNGQHYLTWPDKEEEARRLDLEVVPLLYLGRLSGSEVLQDFLTRDSFLGGCQLEGIVIKNYERFGVDGKVLMGKWVREGFKEVNSGNWKATNPSQNDVIRTMVQVYKTEARWDKAIQHLRDDGKLQGIPQDIGLIVKEFQADLMAECGAEIKEKLFEFAAPKIIRGASGGIAEYYKTKLAES